MTKSLKFHLNSKLQLLECGDQIQAYCHRAGRRETVENYLNNHSEFCSQSFHILAANIGQLSCSHPLAAVSFQHSSNLGCPYYTQCAVGYQSGHWINLEKHCPWPATSLQHYQLTNIRISDLMTLCMMSPQHYLECQCQWVNNNFTMKLDMHFLCLFCGDGDGWGS